MNTEDQVKKRNTLIVIIIGSILFLAIIIFAIIQLIGRIGKVSVNVSYAPFIAEVTANNIKLKNNATNYLAPGEYQVTVSSPNFETLQETVTIKEDTTDIYGMLGPNTEEGQRIYDKYQDDFLEVQALYGKASIAEGEAQRKEWPILSFLPQNNILYSLGYILENNSLTITVRSSNTYLDSALDELFSLAQAPQTIATYDVKLTDFPNRLTNFVKNTNTNPIEYLRTGYKHIPELSIQTGQQNGEYYYTTILVGSEEDYMQVTYRAILKKIENSWELTSTPYPVVTTTNHPDIPLEILNLTNSL